jgi:uncharacterized protein DUF5666
MGSLSTKRLRNLIATKGKIVMNKRMHSVLAILAFTLGSAIAFAHNGIEHVMGTVTVVTDTSVTVDTVKHTSVTVLIDPTTTFSNNDAQATRKDLKVGQRVVINAKENADKKLVGVSVKWGASAATHGEHKN